MENQLKEIVNSFYRQEEEGLTDGQLLARFLERRDRVAIAVLVQRHGPMVWGVCRRVLQNHHDAEDAFQATFLVLIRKAGSIRQGGVVANWLYGVAHQTAMKARSMAAKRRAREHQGTAVPEPQAPASVPHNDLQLLLDQELSRLPDKYRIAIVLCDLEGKTRREAAGELGLPEGTLAGRLTRGRALLARRLTRRGLTVTVGVLAEVLARESASAGVPSSVVASTIDVLGLFAAGTGAGSVHVAALTEGVLKSMLLTKLRIPLTVVFALTLAGAGIAHQLVRTPAVESDQPAPKPDLPAPGVAVTEQPKPAAAKSAAAASQEFLNDALKEFEAAADEQGDGTRLLGDMAGLQAQLGDREAAKRVFERARDTFAALPESQQPDAWSWMACALARAGSVDEAIAVALRIPKGQQRDNTIRQMASALARKRLEKEALRVAAMVEKEELKSWMGAWLLEELALAHATAGDIPEALRVVDRMKDPSSQVTALLGRIRLNLTYDYPFDQEALGIAFEGKAAEAKKSLQRVADLIAAMPDTPPRTRELALTQLACAQARLGEFATAKKTAEKIKDETGKAIALATLVRHLAAAGRAKEAMAEIDPLPAGTTKLHALTHLGAGQAEGGDLKAARASFEAAHLLIKQLPGDGEQMGQALILGTVRANSGDFKGAIQTAEAYFPQNDLGYANIAYGQAQAGDFKGALATAAMLKNVGALGRQPPWWKLESLRATAAQQAKHGESKAALKWIDQLDSHLARAYALMGLAEGTAPSDRAAGKK
jgi:RNA polymerase sigma factor (sigma-70 family)